MNRTARRVGRARQSRRLARAANCIEAGISRMAVMLVRVDLDNPCSAGGCCLQREQCRRQCYWYTTSHVPPLQTPRALPKLVEGHAGHVVAPSHVSAV